MADHIRRVRGRRLDGVVAKRAEEPYQPRGRWRRSSTPAPRTVSWPASDGTRTVRHPDRLAPPGALERRGAPQHVGVTCRSRRGQRAELVEFLEPYRKDVEDHPWREWAMAEAAAAEGGKRLPARPHDGTGEGPLLGAPAPGARVRGRLRPPAGDRFRHAATFRRWRTDRTSPTAATTSWRRRRRPCWPTCSEPDRAVHCARSPCPQRGVPPCPSPPIRTSPSTASPTDSGRASSSATCWATLLGDERYNDRWPDSARGPRRRRGRVPRDAGRGEPHPGEGLRAGAGHTRDLLILVSRTTSRRWPRSSTSSRSTTCPAPRWPARWRSTSRPTRRSGLAQLLSRWTRHPQPSSSTSRRSPKASPTVGRRRPRLCAAPSSRSTGLAMAPPTIPATTMVSASDEDRPRIVDAVERTSTRPLAASARTSPTSTSRTRRAGDQHDTAAMRRIGSRSG